MMRSSVSVAISHAKRRDGGRCLVCGIEGVDGAHLFRRRKGEKFAKDENFILSLCRKHHQELTPLYGEKCIEWLESYYLISWAKKYQENE